MLCMQQPFRFLKFHFCFCKFIKIYIKEKKLHGRNTGINCKRFRMKILTFLKQITEGNKKNTKWLLSVSNNHSGDFQHSYFMKMLRILEKSGFEYFGTHPSYKPHNLAKPNIIEEVTLNGQELEVNICSGTMWENKPYAQLISSFNKAQKGAKSGKFNIFYPHWHFENESYIRNSFRHKALNLVRCGIYENTTDAEAYTGVPWDIVFGHHSHIPQHIELVKETGNPDKLIFYSGGNFTSGEKRRKHRNGLIANVYLGLDNGKLIINKVKWSFTITKKIIRTVELNPIKNKKGKMALKDVFI